jgi:hypothetical protein
MVLTRQANVFITSSLFELWARLAFFLNIEQRSEVLACNGKGSLLPENLGSHHTANFLGDRTTRNIEILPLIPHASDQIQPLDLFTFALMKQISSASRFNRLSNPQSNKMIHG